MLNKPEKGEYPSYFDLAEVPDGDVLELLGSEMEKTVALLESVSPELETHRYAEGKWTVREVVGHVIDVERLFAYRALSFARAEPAAPPGMDDKVWAAASNAAQRSLTALIDEFRLARRGHIAMFEGFADDVWDVRGRTTEHEFSVRSMPYIMLAHEIHHREIVRDRYLS
jgi:uncharacterized damage-inducible protein DinB